MCFKILALSVHERPLRCALRLGDLERESEMVTTPRLGFSKKGKKHLVSLGKVVFFFFNVFVAEGFSVLSSFLKF